MTDQQESDDASQICQGNSREIDTAIAGNHRKHDTQRQKSKLGHLRRHGLQIIAIHKIGAGQQAAGSKHGTIDQR